MTHPNPADRMTLTARAWLDRLDDAQRAQAQLPWPSDEERHLWYYTPTDHGGLPPHRLVDGRDQLRVREAHAQTIARHPPRDTSV